MLTITKWCFSERKKIIYTEKTKNTNINNNQFAYNYFWNNVVQPNNNNKITTDDNTVYFSLNMNESNQWKNIHKKTSNKAEER